jgi:hypothetical protein
MEHVNLRLGLVRRPHRRVSQRGLVLLPFRSAIFERRISTIHVRQSRQRRKKLLPGQDDPFGVPKVTVGNRHADGPLRSRS